jgi:hypothetical protein
MKRTENKCGEKNRRPNDIKKNGKSMNKRLAQRTTVERCSATSRPPLGLLPELFCFEFKDALLKCLDNLKDKVSHVYGLRNIYCFWDDQNKVRIMRTIFILSCLWRVL